MGDGPDVCSMMFDAAVYLVMFVAVIAGFRAGFLRSAVTIFAYVAAMPLAAAAMSLLSPALAGQANAPWSRAALSNAPWGRNSLLFFGLFLVIGIVLGYLLRLAINETVGARIGIPDRLAGSALGAIRVALVAVMMVLIFDQLIPANQEPAFLRGSQLKPVLSMAAQQGLKSLPPETTAFIDQLKKDRRL
jgi:membrane protein required for colicin V production